MEITKDYLASIIDHTLLKPNATTKDVDHLLEEAVMYHFGTVCIRPCDLRYVHHNLEGTGVKTCTVLGFPWGIQSIENKVKEAYAAVRDGADELDIVINRGYLKGGRHDLSKKELNDIVIRVNENIIIKAILETCELTEEEIKTACKIAEESGVDYVKTSTGLYEGATVKAVKLMHKTVPNLGVKASGGIKDWETAYKMIKAGATRIGTSSSVKILSEYMKKFPSEQAEEHKVD